MGYPPIQIVDERDTPLRGASMDEAHAQGLIHRVAYVLIEDDRGNILLQKRSRNVAVYPDCWDVSASGHVDEGESYEQAAYRELAEEIGLTGYTLKKLGVAYDDTTVGARHLKRFCATFKTQIPADAIFNLAAQEVSEVRWFSLAEINHLLADPKAPVAAGLSMCVKNYYTP